MLLFSKNRCLAFLIIFLFVSVANACTNWASVGDVNANGGLLLVKNRDAPHQGLEKLALIHPKKGIPYLALAYNTDGGANYPYISAGVNQNGLAVVNNAASGYPVKYDREQGETTTMRNILQHYGSVADVLKHAKKLFSNSLVNYLIIGDPKQIVTVEIGPKGLYCVYGATRNGAVYHTNQYQCSQLKQYNLKYFSDSLTRYHTIGSLLKTHSGKYSFSDFYRYTNRRQNGDNASIFRKWTAATWILQYPDRGVPLLYVRFTLPTQPYHVYRLQLTPTFWQQSELPQYPSQ